MPAQVLTPINVGSVALGYEAMRDELLTFGGIATVVAGTILAREPNGFDNQSGFLKAYSQDPTLRAVKLIAEPGDCGPGG